MQDLSLGKSKRVGKYVINKLPLGKYLKAVKRLDNLQEDFIEEFAPKLKGKTLMEFFTTFETKDIQSLITSLLTTSPKFLLGLVSDLSEIDYNALENDSDIGLVGLVEIVNAIVEVNELKKLGKLAKGLKNPEKLTTKLQKILSTGYKS